MKQLQTRLFFIFVLLTCAANARAEADLEYPELLVKPLASERLLMEARGEESGSWYRYIPFEVSGLATIIATSQASQDRGTDAGSDATSTYNAAYAAGGATLVTAA